jgi:hypothetical protein
MAFRTGDVKTDRETGQGSWRVCLPSVICRNILAEREFEVPSVPAIITSAAAGEFEGPVITGEQLVRRL